MTQPPQDLPNLDEWVTRQPEDIRNDLAAQGTRDLYFFGKAILGYQQMVPHCHRPLCLFFDENQSRFKLVLHPRGTFKTSAVTISRSTQKACANPNERICIINEVADNAQGFLGTIRQHFENNKVLRALYSHVIPKDYRKTTWNNQALRLNREWIGPEDTLEAMGILSTLTSHHYTHLAYDDIISEDAVKSPQVMTDTIERAKKFRSLMVSPAESTLDIIGTRWALHDVYSYFIKSLDTALAKYIRGAIKPDGSLLFPELLDVDTLASLRSEYGEYMFSCNPEEAPILMADWTSKSIAEVRVGDIVVGFEFPDNEEKMRTIPTKVVAVGNRVAQVYKITMMSGRVIRCTKDHHWISDIVHRKDRPHMLYRPAAIGRVIHYLCDPDGARSIQEQDTPISIDLDGEETVYSLQTETGNYVCWGYGSRNCLYQNNPRDVANQDFNVQDLKFWRWSMDGQAVVLFSHDGVIEDEWPLSKLDITTSVDLAVAERITSDCNAVVTVGCSPKGQAVVLEAWVRRCTPLEVIQHLMWVRRRFLPRAIGIESVAYQKAFKYFLRAECERQQTYINIVELKAIPSKRGQGNNTKEMRIRGLQPIAATGRLYILPTMHDLRNQLSDFPLGEHDDCIDALAHQLVMWRGLLSPERMNKYKMSERELIRRIQQENTYNGVDEIEWRSPRDTPHPDDLGIEVPQFSQWTESAIMEH